MWANRPRATGIEPKKPPYIDYNKPTGLYIIYIRVYAESNTVEPAISIQTSFQTSEIDYYWLLWSSSSSWYHHIYIISSGILFTTAIELRSKGKSTAENAPDFKHRKTKTVTLTMTRPAVL